MKTWGISFSVALGATLLTGGIASGRNEQGVPVHGLRWERGVFVPCPLDWRPSETRSPQSDNTPSHQLPPPSKVDPERERQAALERQRQQEEGERLSRDGSQHFMKSEWAEALRLYSLALEKCPNNADIYGNVQMARVALRAEKRRLEIIEENRQREATAVRQMGEGLESLCGALTTLRSDACKVLLAEGKLADALRAPTQPGFLLDSRTVDLRHVREGVVNLDVLRPPPRPRGGAVDILRPPPRTSQESAIEFPRPAREPEPPQAAEARKVLKSPAVDALLFSATLREALQGKASPDGYLYGTREELDREAAGFARVVAAEVARRAGVPPYVPEEQMPGGGTAVRAESPERGNYFAALQVKSARAYRSYMKRRFDLRGEARDQGQKDFEEMERRLRDQRLLEPGESIYLKEQNDPEFRARVQPEERRVVLRYEVNLLAGDRAAFEALLAEVGELLIQPVPRPHR
jgi:hypothetical protein